MVIWFRENILQMQIPMSKTNVLYKDILIF